MKSLFWIPFAGLAAVAAAQPLSITTPSPLPTGTVGTAYVFTFTAAGGLLPYTWGYGTGVPAGLTLDSANGRLSGTPTAYGTVSFTIQVRDGAGSFANKVFTVTIAGSPLSVQTGTLSNGTFGVPYSQTLTASGGSPPYVWTHTTGMPSGVALDPASGVLSGTPAVYGAFSFTVQVRDNAGNVAKKVFTITISASPLTIQTGTLFNGTVGVPYSQTFTATGGIPPYTWSLSGDVGAFAFDAATATLAGTPAGATTYPFTVRVTDSASVSASKGFTLVVEVSRISILNASALPAGNSEKAYSYQFTAAGGSAPYRWSITAGSAGKLALNSGTGVLSGVPSTPGSYSFSVTVTDTAGQSATKPFSVSIAAKTLSIVTPTQLPDATVASPVLDQITAIGGTPPYTWSVNGLPDGLQMDSSTGVISGVLKMPGSLLFTVRVTDSARATAVELFRMTVNVPALPEVTILGIPPTADPADQLFLRLTLSEGYPLELSGELALSFAPDSGNGDASIQFAAGGRTLPFKIDARSTRPSMENFALQTGTVAGTIRLTVYLRIGDTDITPNPPPAFSTRIERSKPEIRSAVGVRGASTISIQVSGFSTAREITQAVFRFKAAAGQTLRTSEITVPVEDIFSKYFQDASSTQYGGQFVFTQPFTVQGDPNSVIPDSVILTNRGGSTTASVTP